jgi:hypothetical protein
LVGWLRETKSSRLRISSRGTLYFCSIIFSLQLAQVVENVHIYTYQPTVLPVMLESNNLLNSSHMLYYSCSADVWQWLCQAVVNWCSESGAGEQKWVYKVFNSTTAPVYRQYSKCGEIPVTRK